MTPETKQLVMEMRSQIPASISLCQRALASANNDLGQAISSARDILTRELAARLSINVDTAQQYLGRAGYDAELAAIRWQADNPAPPPPNRDVLLAGGELAVQLPNDSQSLGTFLHIIPDGDGRFDVRLFTHDSKYTEEHYGLDYDYAILDSTTRIARFNAIDFDSVCEHLNLLGVDIDDLEPPTSIDSCLVNTTIDSYLAPDRHPHLWQC
jgi:hypothetical protein